MPHIVRQPGVLAGTRIAVFLALVHAVNDVLTAVLGALLPTLQVRFGATTTTLAVLVAAFSISSSITQPLLGALADRYGLRQVAGAGVALAATSLSLIGVIDRVALLVALLIVGGIGSGALHPVATSIVSGPSSKNPSLAVGLFTAGGMAGFAVGPILVLYLLSGWGADATPWLMIPGLVLAAGMFTLLPTWEPHHAGRVRRVFDRNLFTNAAILRLTGTATLVSLTFITATSAVPLWLVTEKGLATDDALLGWTLGLFSLSAGAGAVAGGYAGTRLGYGRTTLISLAAAVPALIAIVLLPVGVATLAAAAVAGALLYASQPLLIVVAQGHVPHSPAAAAGVVIGIGHALAGLLYVGVGALQGVFGLAAVLVLTFVLPVPAAFISAVALHDRGRARSTTTPSTDARSPSTPR
jgi:MFS transporter, FSR family, fosmidomycin resistance protein